MSRLKWAFYVDGMPFDGSTLQGQKSLGGSETAGLCMARELAKRGHDVFMFCRCDQEGIYEGVRYQRVERFGEWAQVVDHDITVVQRLPQVFALQIASPVHLLWAHDLAMKRNAPAMQGAMWNIDKILVLSRFMKNQYAEIYGVPEEAMYVTRNGIDLAIIGRAEEPGERDMKALIYTARPERGMDILLEHTFPNLLKEDPELRLYIAGYDNYVEQLQPLYEKVRWLMQSHAGKARHLGALSKLDLYKLYKASALYIYSTDFEEISCCVGDTLIDMPRDYRMYPNGVPIKDLVGRRGFPVYSYDLDKKQMTLGTVKWVKKTRKNAEVWRLTLDDGNCLRASPDHLIMMRDGTYQRLDQLKPGDSLMPLYKKPYVSVVRNDGTEISEHRLVGEWKENRQLDAKEHSHHLASNWDNSPQNIEILSHSEHMRRTHKGRKRLPEVVEKYKKAQKAIALNTPSAILTERARKRAHRFWDNLSKDERTLFVKHRAEKISEAGRKKQLRALADSRQIAIANSHTSEINARRSERMRLCGSAKANSVRWNHVVVSVHPDGKEDVYDMEVKIHHNFVASGIVIHNCITAMETMACGLPMVCTANAALPETLHPEAGRLVEYDEGKGARDVDYQKQFTEACMGFLTDHSAWSKASEAGKEAAQHLGWEGVAEDWEVLVTGLLDMNAGSSVSDEIQVR